MSIIKPTSTNFSNKKSLENDCLEVYTSNLISGQWVLPICYALLEKKLRFADFKEIFPNITDRVLTLQLRKLERNKILKRTVYPEVPPRVEYELTSIGNELKPVIKELERWGAKHKEYVSVQNKINGAN
ncbi:winged helix-turn-helix transcriptional regulator [Zunongwangia pacifica]|uniref:Winged helix-turn-helix transcriptional regulator n=1 Tax=Zunongwangia pacifica TaxID=2911062 RepID=A0A9X2CNT6_9FLAO|nr:winged helix-turn-helix transcriptional regulator [Zunongwangia pacifica]MCL6220905.1 winged helix-turn-helix transcriptional regulator [Zunongwangia pacifica]